ncbi:peroxin-14 [Entomortierella parvispora]|uniref:Peroxisomal membrane protein PEX14 n=1 Tax=Entomortierella parvispora TaxID=205924 RepID=A0A9P3H7L7_9FUNG|nr:peroxin-14 [Entomortierella parvispora]
MSDNSTSSPDAVQQLLQGNNGAAAPITAEQRNDRREALLKRQREQREKAQQLSQSARANASSPSAPSTTTPAAAPATTPAAAAAEASTPVAAAVATPEAPVRENMVQQAVSFLSSPSVQSADEAKKTQFLEKKGLTAKEIELARARIAGKPVAAAAASTGSVATTSTPAVATGSTAVSNSGPVPPPVPPRNYAPVQGYPQQPVMYMQQPPAVVDPNAFKRKLVIAMLISGGLTIFSSIIIQKLLYPMIRGITGARQSLAGSQTELLSKLKEKLKGYKDYLLGMHLGSNRFAPANNLKEETSGTTLAVKDTKTTVEDEDAVQGEKTVAVVKATTPSAQAQYQSTVKQLDAFSKTLENHAGKMSFEQLKATRAVTQDLAEYITKETYALTHSIAYPTSRYYGYNTAGAAASGKGGLADPTTPESALKSEIRSLKGLLLNWRNFPVAKEGASALPNLVQGQ